MAEQAVWWSVGMGVCNKLLAAPSQPQQVQGIKLNKLTLSPPPGIDHCQIETPDIQGKAYSGGDRIKYYQDGDDDEDQDDDDDEIIIENKFNFTQST